MKLKIPYFGAGAAVLLAGLLLAGCDQQSSDAKHIKVGVINGAEQDVAEVAKKVAKEKYGLEVELVGFSGSLLPNDATNHGELDANVFQHRPFLEQDNKAHGYKLVAVGNTFVFPMAGYSKKIKTVAELKDGATIAIPNDPTNLGRALLLLQKEKLITLKADTGLLPQGFNTIRWDKQTFEQTLENAALEDYVRICETDDDQLHTCKVGELTVIFKTDADGYLIYHKSSRDQVMRIYTNIHKEEVHFMNKI